MDIDPRRLPFLLSVAREGGIVAAADILMVSPSAVSQQIQKLEEEVGLKLVERTTSGAILTPAGTIVAEAGERINADIASSQGPEATDRPGDRHGHTGGIPDDLPLHPDPGAARLGGGSARHRPAHRGNGGDPRHGSPAHGTL